MKLYHYGESGDATVDHGRLLIGHFSTSNEIIDHIRKAHPEATEFVVIATRPDQSLDHRLWVMEFESVASGVPVDQSSG